MRPESLNRYSSFTIDGTACSCICGQLNRTWRPVSRRCTSQQWGCPSYCSPGACMTAVLARFRWLQHLQRGAPGYGGAGVQSTSRPRTTQRSPCARARPWPGIAAPCGPGLASRSLRFCGGLVAASVRWASAVDQGAADQGSRPGRVESAKLPPQLLRNLQLRGIQ